MEPLRAVDPQNRAVEAWTVRRPGVADSHHLDEEQDPDPH